jgi:hypothetical protein
MPPEGKVLIRYAVDAPRVVSESGVVKVVDALSPLARRLSRVLWVIHFRPTYGFALA